MSIRTLVERTVVFCVLVFLCISIPVSSWGGDLLAPEGARGLGIAPGRSFVLSLPLDRMSMSMREGLEAGRPSRPIGNPGDTLRWDDGSSSTWLYYFSGGNGGGVEFEPYYYPCKVASIIQYFPSGWPDPGGDDLILWIVDDDGPGGSPGTILSADTLINAITLGDWNEFTVNDTGVVIQDGNFYGVYIQLEDGPNCPAMVYDSGYEVVHTWDYYNGEWNPSATYGDLLLRAYTQRAGGPAHDVGVLSIVAPGEEYEAGSSVAPSAVVKNWGAYTEDFDVECRIELEGATSYVDTANVSSLGAGTTETVSFSQWSPGSGNVYQVAFTTLLPGDVTPGNDSRVVTTHNYTVQRRQALVEEATGTWCVYCPYAADGLDSLREEAGDSVAIVAYHDNDDFSNGPGNSRLAYYNISAYPTVIFDGISRVTGGSPTIYNSYRAALDEEFQSRIPVDILLQGNYNEATRNGVVYVDLNAVDGIPGTDLRLYTVLAESHIPYSWQQEDSLHFVQRGMFPDSTGIPVYLSKGDSDHEVVNFSVDPAWVDSHCEVVVFLQDYPSREVYASASSPIMDLTVSIGDEGDMAGLPRALALSQNYPNPFNPRTTIAYQVPEGNTEGIELAVYDLRGRLVRVLDSGRKAPGTYRVTWDGRDGVGRGVGSGIYIYRLRSGNWEQRGKMVLLK